MAKKPAKTEWPESCKSCRFMQMEPRDDAGYCRRYPPAPVTDDEGMCFTFPEVLPEDWCGEFRPVEN